MTKQAALQQYSSANYRGTATLAVPLNNTPAPKQKNNHQAVTPELPKQQIADDHWLFLLAGSLNIRDRRSPVSSRGLYIIGINQLGERHVLAVHTHAKDKISDWENLLQQLKVRKMNSPRLAIGAGQLRFWNALQAIYPKTNHQCIWNTSANNNQDFRSPDINASDGQLDEIEKHMNFRGMRISLKINQSCKQTTTRKLQ